MGLIYLISKKHAKKKEDPDILPYSRWKYLEPGVSTGLGRVLIL